MTACPEFDPSSPLQFVINSAVGSLGTDAKREVIETALRNGNCDCTLSRVPRCVMCVHGRCSCATTDCNWHSWACNHKYRYTSRTHPVTQFRAVKAFVDRLGTPALVVPGNHDIPLFDLWARLRIDVPNSVNLLRWDASSIQACCRIERWCFSSDAHAFLLTNVTEIKPARGDCLATPICQWLCRPR